MLIITNAATMGVVLNLPLSPPIKALLVIRRDQLLSVNPDGCDIGELAHWIIVQPGDTLAAIEKAAGFPIAPDPPWEWVLTHDGILEAPIIFNDDGFGVVLIVPDVEGVDRTLLTLLHRDAVVAPPMP